MLEALAGASLDDSLDDSFESAAAALFIIHSAVASVTGIIQSARLSLTVVAVARASEPNFAAAPTTELVS